MIIPFILNNKHGQRPGDERDTYEDNKPCILNPMAPISTLTTPLSQTKGSAHTPAPFLSLERQKHVITHSSSNTCSWWEQSPNLPLNSLWFNVSSFQGSGTTTMSYRTEEIYYLNSDIKYSLFFQTIRYTALAFYNTTRKNNSSIHMPLFKLLMFMRTETHPVPGLYPMVLLSPPDLSWLPQGPYRPSPVLSRLACHTHF